MPRENCLIFVVLAVTACAEVEEARLDHSQILAVRLDPPQVAPGGRARVDVLAGDVSGNVFESDPTALETELAVDRTAEGWFVTAPQMPGVVPLGLTLEIDGESFPASKQLVVAEPGANPRVTTMQIDGESASGEPVLAKGTKPRLAAFCEGGGEGGDLRYAWYSSVGDLKFYRQPEAELDAATRGEGLVVVVVRDAVGGVGWQIAPARVE